MKYKMSKEMYDMLKQPNKGGKNRHELSEKEILEYVNSTFGLLREVTEIYVD